MDFTTFDSTLDGSTTTLVPAAAQAAAQPSSSSLLGDLSTLLGAVTPIAQTVIQATVKPVTPAGASGDGAKVATPVAGVPTTGTTAGISNTTLLLGGGAVLLTLLLVLKVRGR